MSDAEKDLAAKAEAPATNENLSLLDEVIQATRLKPADEGYNATKNGLQFFLDQMLKSDQEIPKVTQAAVDEMISKLDVKISAQMDEILHNEEFKKLESAWTSLKYLVNGTNFRENTKIEMVNISKQDLLDDFEDAPEINKSGLYKTVYTSEYGQFGGKPFGMMIGNYTFGPGSQDVKLLQSIASVATMSHAPFVASAGPEFFGVENFSKLPDLKDLKSIFEMPQYTKWQSFRESEDARNISLTLPRFLLRLPYGADTKPVKSFNYTENVAGDSEKFLWGNAAFSFASRVTNSFAKYRWCANIIGPQGGGAVEDLPVYHYEAMGELQTKIPTEILISERREFELAEEGFMGLTMRKGSDNAAFFSANSVQKPKVFPNTPEGKQAEANYKLGTQLPYTFIISRLAHYIKVIQRENIGTSKTRTDLENELNTWLSQYIADQDDVSPAVRSSRPLRKASITVSDVEGDPGWYKVGLTVQPHFKYMGASFTLSLAGKLDK